MTAAFAISVVEDALSAQQRRLEGEDLERLAKFFTKAEGVPQFALDHDGRHFSGCHTTTEEAADSMCFWFESVAPTEEGIPES